MDKLLERFIKSHSSGLNNEYTDITELNRNLSGLNAALEVERESTIDYPEQKMEQDVNIKAIEKQITHIKTAINQFPDYPELPPSQPLIKISGVIEALSIRKVIGYFEASEYTTYKEAIEKKRQKDNTGAMILMITQMFTGNLIHARVNDGERKKSKCIYVEGIISGKKFSGWLAKTNVRLGDYIEMAVMPCGNEYKMYALANPQQRTISTTPKCSFGIKRLSFMRSLRTTAVFTFFIFIFAILFFPDNLPGVIAAYVIVTLIFNYAVYKGIHQDVGGRCLLMTDICHALSIPGGELIDLGVYTIKKIEQLQSEGKWLSPEQETVEMPQSQVKRPDDYFYYY